MPPLWLAKLNLEVTSHCNLDCRFCSLRLRPRREHMSPDLFRNVLAQLADPAALRVRTLHLYQAGELLLHPQWPELLRLLAAAKTHNAFFPNVYASTNAAFLTPEVAAAVLDTEAIDVMHFSFDGGSPADFADIRPGLSWELVHRQIGAFLAARDARRRPVYVALNITTTRPTVDFFNDCSPAWRDLCARADRINVHPPQELDTRLAPAAGGPDYSGPCALTNDALSILADGSVAPCCAYLENRHRLGQLPAAGIAEIFTGSARRELLRNLDRHQRQDNPICRYCNVRDRGVTAGHAPQMIYRARPEFEAAQLRVRLRALARQAAAPAPAAAVIFGSGPTGRWLAALAAEAGLPIRCFIDNDPARVGINVMNTPVLAPAALRGQTPVPVLIASRARAPQMAEEFSRGYPDWPCCNLMTWVGP